MCIDFFDNIPDDTVERLPRDVARAIIESNQDGLLNTRTDDLLMIRVSRFRIFRLSRCKDNELALYPTELAKSIISRDHNEIGHFSIGINDAQIFFCVSYQNHVPVGK